MLKKNLANHVLPLALLVLTACSTNLPATETPKPADPRAPSSPSPQADLPETRTQPTAIRPDIAPVVPHPASLPTEAAEAGLLPSPTADDGLTEDQRWLLASLESLGPAPELQNEIWLNSAPLRLADLRGQVVLLEMWTFG